MPGDPARHGDDLVSFFESRLEMARRARERLIMAAPERSHLRRVAEDILGMIDAYLSDARHLANGGDLPRAIEAVSYAYGWIDAAVRIGLLDGGDEDMFTLAS